MFSLKCLVVVACFMAITFAETTEETNTAAGTTEATIESTIGPDTGEETVANASKIYVKVKGNSGKIVIGKTADPDNDPKKMIMDFDSVKEKSSAGVSVGKSGNKKHSFNTFASQKFTFGPMVDDEYQNINAKMFNFTSMINGADLTVDVFIFTGAGNITNDGEETRVKAGNVKLNIMMTGWKFCGSGVDCTQGNTAEFGDFVDLTITIKQGNKAGVKAKNQNAKNSSTEGDVYAFDNGGAVTFSKKVEKDGVWENMTANYPMSVMLGAKQMFTFRFPKFTTKVLYDPVFDLSGDDGDDGDDGTSAGTSAGSFNFLSVIQTLAMLLACMFL